MFENEQTIYKFVMKKKLIKRDNKRARAISNN